MRPRKREESHSDDLFRARLDQIINMKHAVVRLAEEIDWDWIDDQVGDLFSAEGRPGTETRFMIGILLLKQIYGISDEGVWERWVHDPYFQYFTGETFFQHAIPHERSRVYKLLLRYAVSSGDVFIAHSRQDHDDLKALRPRAIETPPD